MKKEPDEVGTCFKCNKSVDKGMFCFGCKHYICEVCDVSCGNYPWGGHNKEAHLVEPEDE